ncbi:MAG: hypothetical protein JWQ78_336 [Sediminibacterium sp.]|nr:hypothetical protein [Sediminibacterium sp.]
MALSFLYPVKYMKMKTAKYIGIWMDHAHANVMALTTAPMETVVVTSAGVAVEDPHESGSEFTMNNKNQHKHSSYYKQLAAILKEYDHVILFGPTDAKTELFNLLKADQHFASTTIDVRQTDKMSENQQYAFVREHFATH